MKKTLIQKNKNKYKVKNEKTNIKELNMPKKVTSP